MKDCKIWMKSNFSLENFDSGQIVTAGKGILKENCEINLNVHKKFFLTFRIGVDFSLNDTIIGSFCHLL